MLVVATLAMVIVTVAISVFWQSEIRKSRHARNLARAQQVAEIASLFDLYVHLNKTTFAQELVGRAAVAYELTNADLALYQAFADGVVSPVISGFDLTYLVTVLPDGEKRTGIFGVLHLTANEDPAYSDLDGLLVALEGFGLASGKKGINTHDRLLSVSDQMESWFGRGLAGAEAVILTAELSGVPRDYVLREYRAGHPLPVFSDAFGALDLAGNNLTGVALTRADSVTATNVNGAVAANSFTGSLRRVIGSLTVDGRITAPHLQIKNALFLGAANITSGQTGQTAVTGAVTVTDLTATAGPVTAADMFAGTMSVANDVTGVNRVIASDVLVDGALTPTTLDATTLTSVQASFGTLTVGGSCAGC
ncbi:hypothetical protein [Ruegeria atlantica]|uniref:hypothetical protein n=1 Tax=Ruegeria atlantica TaxID=81569 RepID=UPI00147AFF04|nr:hypothetical protein [Ruegeria atlantica]